MTHEQKPESAEFRTREAQKAAMIASYGNVHVMCIDDWVARNVIEAEARGAAEQRRKDAEGQEVVGHVSDIQLKALCSGNHEAVTLRAQKGGDDFRTAWGEDHPLYTRPANVAALEDRVKELEGEVKEEQRIANLRAEVIDNLTNRYAAMEQEKHEAVAAELERCAKLCESLAQSISHERGSFPDWETGEVTLDELSQVEFEAFERAAAAIREGGE